MKKKASILEVLLVVLLALSVIACNDANITIPEDPAGGDQIKLGDWKAFPLANNLAPVNTIKTAEKEDDDENKYLEVSLNFIENLTSDGIQIEFYGNFDESIDVTDYTGICFKAKYDSAGFPFEFFLSQRKGNPTLGAPGTNPVEPSTYTGKATATIGRNINLSGRETEGWQEFTWEWKVADIVVNGWNTPASMDWNVVKKEITRYMFLIGRGENANGTYTLQLDDIGFIKADGTKVIYADFED